jgi:hypothetical protein
LAPPPELACCGSARWGESLMIVRDPRAIPSEQLVRWPMQGIEVWANAEAAGSYDGEVKYFTNWLNLRIA